MSNLLACRLAYEGDLESLKKEIESDAEAAAKRDEDGRVALHWASSGKQVDIVRFLLGLESMATRTADLPDEDGWTPLIIACASGNASVVQALLDAKVVINATNHAQASGLHYAASKNRIEVVQLLLQQGADVSAKDRVGETPLHRAAALNFVRIAKLLIEHGADPAAKDNSGNTCMHTAMKEESSDVVTLIYENMPSIMFVKNSSNEGPIDLATDEMMALMYDLKKEKERKVE
eukprot:CFRG5406T1